MAEYKQTVFYGENGNCLQAAVASILDLPMDAVPNFSPFRRGWFDALMLWAESNGYEVWPAEPTHVPDLPMLAFGLAERGFQHAVVWQGNALLHDPHPSNAGLIEPEQFWAVTVADPETSPESTITSTGDPE